MAMQPIIESGRIVDEYDDDLSEETSSDYPQEQVLESPPEITSPEVSTPTSTEPLPEVQKEDMTSFDQSDIVIQIMLHHADGHPEGRLVSILVHNFAGEPVIETFREAALTEQSRLDCIHRAIYPLMQRFLLDLATRSRKKVEEDAKRVAKPMKPQTVVHEPALPAMAVTSPSSSPATKVPTALAQIEPVSKGSTKKKGKQESKYQSIPMF